MVNRRKQPVEPVEERPGSGQSRESFNRDFAAQPTLLAGKTPAKSRKRGGTVGIDKTGKRLFVIGGPKNPSMKTNSKKSKATFKLAPCTYQVGDKKGELTGNVRYLGVPTYGKNTQWKETMEPHLLGNALRWVDSEKLYSVKVYNDTQAEILLQAAKSVDAEEAEALKDVEIDKTIFDNASSCEIAHIPSIMTNDVDCMAFGGATFPFKDDLKSIGFQFDNERMLWCIPKDEADDAKIDKVLDKMDKYGFPVEEYDGVAP